VQTYVRGAWHGWKGHTVVQLDDGSKWEQAEYHYEYHYAYRPAASLDGDRLFVEGMSRAIRVRRAR
jgi:hypothetical protein